MDPIADMLTRIRNATLVSKETVVLPHSRLKARIAELLLEHGFLASVETVTNEDGKIELNLGLKYESGQPAIRSLRRLSTPGLRRYRKSTELPRPKGGFGIVVVSTPKGLMTTDQARRAHAGGELICEVLS